MNLQQVIKTNSHVAIFGETGSGKTELAKHIFRNNDHISIFINPGHANIKGFRCEQWNPKILADHQKINFCPDLSDHEFKLWADRICYDVRMLGKALYPEKYAKTHWCSIFLDEANFLMPQNDESEALINLRRGKTYGIKMYIISQNPVDVSKTGRTQCAYHVQFELNNYNVPYYKAHNIPVEEIQRKTSQRYHFVIFDGKSLSEPEKIKI